SAAARPGPAGLCGRARTARRARRTGTAGAGVTGPHAALDLDDLQVLAELDGDQGAVGLLHVGLVHPVTGVGLDPVDGAARNGLERLGAERRRGGARHRLLIRADRPGAAGVRRHPVAAGHEPRHARARGYGLGQEDGEGTARRTDQAVDAWVLQDRFDWHAIDERASLVITGIGR